MRSKVALILVVMLAGISATAFVLTRHGGDRSRLNRRGWTRYELSSDRVTLTFFPESQGSCEEPGHVDLDYHDDVLVASVSYLSTLKPGQLCNLLGKYPTDPVSVTLDEPLHARVVVDGSADTPRDPCADARRNGVGCFRGSAS